jgi:hypothetical protein
MSVLRWFKTRFLFQFTPFNFVVQAFVTWVDEWDGDALIGLRVSAGICKPACFTLQNPAGECRFLAHCCWAPAERWICLCRWCGWPRRRLLTGLPTSLCAQHRGVHDAVGMVQASMTYITCTTIVVGAHALICLYKCYQPIGNYGNPCKYCVACNHSCRCFKLVSSIYVGNHNHHSSVVQHWASFFFS